MKTLRYGSRGQEVELLQLALARGGWYKGRPDGVFGPMTGNAVRRFQAEYELLNDGIAGPNTWSAIDPFLLGSFTVRVRRGDTFARLAHRWGTQEWAIAAANPGADSGALAIGTQLTIPYGFDLVSGEVRYTPELTDYVLDGLALRYPFAKVEKYGSAVSGQPLRLLTFGTGEREVFINAAHHANEWITTPIVLKAAETLLRAKAAGERVMGRSAEELLERVRVIIAPLVDPDGVALVNGTFDASSREYHNALAIAANYPNVPFPEGWKANIEGTDLNLNYPAGWDDAKRIKFLEGWTSPAPRDYVGEAPLSAPESRAVYELTLGHDFALTLSYHTQGREIYWKYRDIEPERGLEIAEKLAEASGYSVAEPEERSSNAGYKDWFILEYGRPGYTVEAGRGVNPLPLSQFGELFSANLPLIVTALELA